MIPVYDLNPRRKFPYVTVALIVINMLVYWWEYSLTVEELIVFYETRVFSPASFLSSPFSPDKWFSIVRSMFLHNSSLHLIGNMYFLYMFGDNIEDRLGGWVYAGFYITCGYISAFVHTIAYRHDLTTVIGASGAIAGLMGAYLLLFPTAKVRSLVLVYPLGLVPFNVPAYMICLSWFGSQVLAQFYMRTDPMRGTVAYMEHIGGFIGGAALLWLLMYWYPQVTTRIPDVPTGRVKVRKKKSIQ